MSERGAKDAGLKPRARIIASTSVGSDPTLALTGPIDATRKLMARTGNSINDVDAFEVNEAFAPVVLAWQKELGVAAERVNCWGGAIALGHPLGGSGARLLTTLLSILDERGGRLGVVTICCNGGLGLALLVESLRI
jgi:acetyl-CoA acyltransferase